jgi:hypothetical protein
LKGKWIVSEIGGPVPFAWSEYDFTSTGALRCEGSFGEFAMNRKNLRFVKTYIYGYWTDAIPGEQAGTFVEGKIHHILVLANAPSWTRNEPIPG